MFHTTRARMGLPRTTARIIAASAMASLALAGCTLSESSSDDEQRQGQPATGGSDAAPENSKVVLVTHDSFEMPDEVLKAFTDETGYTVEVLNNGDAGAMVNKLVLTKDSPLGDAVFGIDNTFATRALDEGVIAQAATELPEGADQYTLDAEGGDKLAPVDYGDVCLNIDDTWFDKKGVNPPETLEDLTKPEYKDLAVIPGAATSSPGLAFLLATIGHFGEDGWEQYWKDLMANGAKLTSGWSDAYTVDFTAGGGDGDRPIVLSYASSPPATIPDGGDKPTTSSLPDTCFRQVEYAGVLEGAENPEGAQALVDFMLEADFQNALPDSMYVYPVRSDAKLPEGWDEFAKPADKPIEVAPKDIADNREEWLATWSDITGS